MYNTGSLLKSRGGASYKSLSPQENEYGVHEYFISHSKKHAKNRHTVKSILSHAIQQSKSCSQGSLGSTLVTKKCVTSDVYLVSVILL